MTFKKPAAIALATLLLLPVPAWSFESNDTSTSTMFYVSIPLDRGGTGKDPGPTFGLQLQGKREHQVVRLDTRMMRFAGLGVDDRAAADAPSPRSPIPASDLTARLRR